MLNWCPKSDYLYATADLEVPVSKAVGSKGYNQVRYSRTHCQFNQQDGNNDFDEKQVVNTLKSQNDCRPEFGGENDNNEEKMTLPYDEKKKKYKNKPNFVLFTNNKEKKSCSTKDYFHLSRLSRLSSSLRLDLPPSF
jgi:hypothetical protein